MWQGIPSHHCAKGFTLIELLLTLALLATLATVAYPLTALMGKRDRELDLQRSLREIRRAIDSYKEASDAGRIEKSISYSGYPPSLQALVEGVTDKTDRKGKKLFFLQLDAFPRRVAQHAVKPPLGKHLGKGQRPMEHSRVLTRLLRSGQRRLLVGLYG